MEFMERNLVKNPFPNHLRWRRRNSLIIKLASVGILLGLDFRKSFAQSLGLERAFAAVHLMRFICSLNN